MLRNISLLVAVGALTYWYFTRSKVVKIEELKKSYDFVIVGGGSAGATLAARLSERAEFSVLLLEAGPEETEYYFTHIPGWLAHLQQTNVDWQYVTEPQSNACLGLKNQKGFWPRGKILGGTSVLNFMMHVRGHPKDHDHWAEDLGCTGWSYNDVLPYYKKLEHILFDADTKYRGKTGPIGVIQPTPTPLAVALLAAADELGFGTTNDYNSGDKPDGFDLAQFGIKNGVRQSTAAVFLRGAMKRKNLHVLTNAHVTKVSFQKKRAVGVNFAHSGKTHSVKAEKEVILTAGSVGSPHILLLSGVGPAEQMHELKIPLVADLPVGNHLSDHPGLYIVMSHNDSSAGTDVSSLGTVFGRFIADLKWHVLKTGFDLAQFGIKNGVRQSTAAVFLRGAMKRKNLHVLTNAHVTKVNFEKKRAVGVSFAHSGKTHSVKAEKEVILSAGSVGSPHILLLSGVGPAEQMHELKIPLVADLPVGKHLSDHPGLHIVVSHNDSSAGTDVSSLGTVFGRFIADLKWHVFKTGLIANPGAELTGRITSPYARLPHIPDLQHMFSSFDNYDGVHHIINYNAKTTNAIMKSKSKFNNYFVCFLNLVKPHTTGEIWLKNTDPFTHPLIDPKYYADKKDLDAMVYGIEKLFEILNSKAMKKYDAKWIEMEVPGCENLKALSKDWIRCYLKQRTTTLNHQSGTCRMGPSAKDSAVVDTKLRVFETKGLRVVDASVFPDQVSGNINIPTIMIAEKAADLIKEDYTS